MMGICAYDNMGIRVYWCMDIWAYGHIGYMAPFLNFPNVQKRTFLNFPNLHKTYFLEISQCTKSDPLHLLISEARQKKIRQNTKYTKITRSVDFCHFAALDVHLFFPKGPPFDVAWPGPFPNKTPIWPFGLTCVFCFCLWQSARILSLLLNPVLKLRRPKKNIPKRNFTQ